MIPAACICPNRWNLWTAAAELTMGNAGSQEGAKQARSPKVEAASVEGPTKLKWDSWDRWDVRDRWERRGSRDAP